MVITTPEIRRLGIDPIRNEVPTLETILLCNTPRNYEFEKGELSYDAEMAYAFRGLRRSSSATWRTL